MIAMVDGSLCTKMIVVDRASTFVACDDVFVVTIVIFMVGRISTWRIFKNSIRD